MGKGAQKDPVSVDEIQKDHVRKEIVASKHWASKFQYYKDENIKVRFIAFQEVIYDIEDARGNEGSSSRNKPPRRRNFRLARVAPGCSPRTLSQNAYNDSRSNRLALKLATVQGLFSFYQIFVALMNSSQSSLFENLSSWKFTAIMETVEEEISSKSLNGQVKAFKRFSMPWLYSYSNKFELNRYCLVVLYKLFISRKINRECLNCILF